MAKAFEDIRLVSSCRAILESSTKQEKNGETMMAIVHSSEYDQKRFATDPLE